MNITSDDLNQKMNKPNNPIEHRSTYPPNLENENNISQKQVTYANASQSMGAISKTNQNPKPIENKVNFWNDQLRKIMSYHNQGFRVLIIMRGAPGCGKSHLSRQIVEMTVGSTYSNYQTHIFSTDDFYMVNGHYRYEKTRLPEAHEWNQRRVSTVAKQGLSPIIVDNTNIEIWEMEPYAKTAIYNGYYLEIMEPKTPWARKAYQLAKRNIHSVPVTVIRRMLDNYQNGVDGEYLKEKFRLSYPPNLIPPVIRLIPPVISDTIVSNPDQLPSENHEVKPILSVPVEEPRNVMKSVIVETNSSMDTAQHNNIDAQTNHQSNICDPLAQELTAEEFARYKLFLDAQKRIEEMAKVEQEWENGENWDEVSKESVSTANENVTTLDPKPPRNMETGEHQSTVGFLDNVNEYNDWTKLSKFMSPWHGNLVSQENNKVSFSVEKISTSTCMEIGDTDISMNKNTLKIIAASPRDINQFHIPLDKEKIPNRRMLDKSSMTNEQSIIEAYRCKNEEKHFVAFRKLFKNVARANLRDIFDNCCGDVNWAVDIVLDSVANKAIGTVESEDLSDTEETDMLEQCDCLAAYNIIPDGAKSVTLQSDKLAENFLDKVCVAQKGQKKPKKESSSSETTLELKRQIEHNVVIPDNHYSKHCLKIRKIRRGEYINDDNEIDQPSTSGCQQNMQTQKDTVVDMASQSDDEDISSTTSREDLEKTVNVNIGMDFVKSLDNLFGRKDMEYPHTVVPQISLPLSILNEINALWMESLMYQLEETSKNMDFMVKQDEEFARYDFYIYM